MSSQPAGGAFLLPSLGICSHSTTRAAVSVPGCRYTRTLFWIGSSLVGWYCYVMVFLRRIGSGACPAAIPRAVRTSARLSTGLPTLRPLSSTTGHDKAEPSSEEGCAQQPGKSRSIFSIARPLENVILRSRLTRDLDLARFLAKATSIAFYTVAGVTVLGTLGVDTKPIIAGIGVTGFTIGFALKEIATNFLSGVLLVFIKPFQKGQYLKVMGAAAGQNMEGTVESIDARYVLLRTKEGGLLMVPSVVVYTNPILVSKSDESQGKKT